MSTSRSMAVCPTPLQVRGPQFETEDAGQRFYEGCGMVGDSVAIERLRTQLQRLGPHFRTVLLTGETGTGKELAARALHRSSPYADGPFVVFSAASVGAAVIEWRGAARTLPTAAGDVDSLLRAAHRGTIYFDQVGEMPAATQAQLLQVLQRRERTTHGPQGMLRIETGIIASTDQDLRVLAAAGRFREDLYYRIATVEITLPPLRERLEDVAALADYFVQCPANSRDLGIGDAGLREARVGVPRGRMTRDALRRLMEYSWPGNVRELENVIRRAVMESDNGVVDVQHLSIPAEGAGTPARPGAGRTARLQEVIEQHVLQVLQCCGGNKVRAAELLGISRSTLYRMLDACASAGRLEALG